MDGFVLTLDAFRAWCDRNSVQYLYNEKLGQIGIPRPNDPNNLLRVIPRPNRGMLTFAYALPVAVPQEAYDRVRTAAMLSNSATFMGAWVLNHGKGELYFRVSVPVANVAYTDASVRYLLQVVIGTVEATSDKMKAVALEGADPSILIQRQPRPDDA